MQTNICFDDTWPRTSWKAWRLLITRNYALLHRLCTFNIYCESDCACDSGYDHICVYNHVSYTELPFQSVRQTSRTFNAAIAVVAARHVWHE